MWLSYTRIQAFPTFDKYNHTDTSKQETHLNHYMQSSHIDIHMFCPIQTHMHIDTSSMKTIINHVINHVINHHHVMLAFHLFSSFHSVGRTLIPNLKFSVHEFVPCSCFRAIYSLCPCFHILMRHLTSYVFHMLIHNLTSHILFTLFANFNMKSLTHYKTS
jgi:hypothetical protein